MTAAGQSRTGRQRIGIVLAALAAAMSLGLLAAPRGEAAPRPIATGISGMGAMNEQSLAEVQQAGASFVRVTAPWQLIAPKERPSEWQPRNPGDPDYNWEFLDREVSQVVAAGLTPLLLVEGAPRWAQRCQSPPNLQYVEVCDPDPAALADFATAVAIRYSGNFGGLPRVRYWQGLDEPNLTLFFFPQFSSAGKPLSADLYRPLINSFYAAVKAVDPSNMVVMGGLGPIAKRGWTIGPMQFTRELLCMRGSAHPKPLPGGCGGGVHFDIFDIHPYTTGGPTHKGGPNDVELGDMKRLQRLIGAADRSGHLSGTRRRTETWVTEFSWDSKPPDPGGMPMKIETRWVAEALHNSWAAGVSNFFWYSLRDEPLGSNPAETLQAGLFFTGASIADDQPKPVLRAFRFPFVAYPRAKGLAFWGRTPSSRAGSVKLEARMRHGWRQIGTAKANRFGIFRGIVKKRYGRGKKGAVRAVVSGQSSSAFSMRPVRDFWQPPFGGRMQGALAPGH